MEAYNFEGCCDFHCYLIKYDRKCIYGKMYRKGCLNDSGSLIPLLWNHNHSDVDSVIGCVTLEYRDDGVYVYGKLFDKPNIATTKTFLANRGSVSVSPFITSVQYDRDVIMHGVIKEVSLIFDRCDRDEAYFPIVVEREEKDVKRNS